MCKGCIIDEDECGVWCILEIKYVKTIWSRRKLDHPRWSKDLEDTPAIFAVVYDFKLLAKLI